MRKNLFFAMITLLSLASAAVNGQSVTHSFTFGGITRSYNVYLPSNFNSSISLPLIFNLHGLNSNGQQEELYTLMDNLADTARCVVVYPEAVNGQWNMVIGCTGSTPPCTGVDDVGFISALIDTMHAGYNIDLGRVYSCGMSDGAYMSFRLACELSCRIAAIGAVAGLLQEAAPLYPACNPTRKMPVVQFHGTADSTVPYSNNPPIASVSSTLNRWISIDNCPSTDVVTNLPDIDINDGCTATELYYGLCGDSTLLIHYRINGGQHTWPGSNTLVSLGVTNYDINADNVLWNFFKQYSIPANLSFTGLAASYCSSGGAVTLTGIPSGGTFSGAGITGSQFNPATAGSGAHVITYTIAYNGCTFTSTKTVTVTTASSGSITGLGLSYCKNAGVVTLSGSPSGGTFSGPGVSGNQFDPQTAGVGGPYHVTYSGNAGGCAFSATQSVTVDSVPNSAFSGLDSAYCLSQGPGIITLTGTPSGGTFSGTGVSANTFDPGTAGGGTFVISYTVTLGSCSAVSTKSVTVISSTTATISGLAANYCADAQAAALTGAPPGGSFSGTGISGSSFNAQTAGPGGPYQITYQGTLAGCSFSGTQPVYVDTVPVVDFTGLDTFYCLSASPNTIVLTGIPSGGIFSGQGITGNQLSIASAGTGAHTITYSYSDSYHCSGSKQSSVRIASCTTGIEGTAFFGELSVFPNPATEALNIQYRTTENEPVQLLIYDMLGKEILNRALGNGTERNVSVDTRDFAQGIFLLKLDSGKGQEVRKIIIQHM